MANQQTYELPFERRSRLAAAQTQGTGNEPDPLMHPIHHPTSATYSPRLEEPQRVQPPCRKRIRIRALTDLEGQLAMARDLIRTCGTDGLELDDFDVYLSLEAAIRRLQQQIQAALQKVEGRG